MRNRIITSIVLGLSALLVVTALTVEKQEEQESSRFWVTDVVTGIQSQLHQIECPSDMPDCSRTARQRYRKWKRGGYGYTRPWRVHYGKIIKRQILRKAKVKWLRHHDSFPRRRLWREYRSGKRLCVANMSFWYFDDPNPGNYCERRWYKDPRRKFVKNVITCGGEIAMAIIASKSAPRRLRSQVVGGTGALCAWDKMP